MTDDIPTPDSQPPATSVAEAAPAPLGADPAAERENVSTAVADPSPTPPAETREAVADPASAPAAAPAPPPSKKRWYVVKVQSGREESIKDAIERRVKIEGLEEFFGQIVIPTEKVTQMRNGKRVVKE